MEINEGLVGAGDAKGLNGHETNHIMRLIIKLRDPAIYNMILEFEDYEIDSMKKILRWSPENSVPCFDLFRVF